MKIIIINFLLIVLFSTISLLIFDLRVENNHVSWQGKGYYQFSKELGFTHIENSSFDIRINKTFSYKGEINNFGMRGPDLDFKQEIIYLAGDSQLFGWGLDDKDTITANLNKLFLNTFSIANGGVSGYGTDQSYERFLQIRKKISRIKHLVFFLNYNDIERINNVEFSLFDLKEDTLVKRDLENSFEMYIRKLPFTTNHYLLQRLLVNVSSYTNLFITLYRSINKGQNYRTILTKQLTSLIELSKKENFKLSIVELPNFKMKSEFNWLKNYSEISLYYSNLNEDPDFTSQNSKLYLSDNDHFNANGSLLLAKKLKIIIEDYSLGRELDKK